ncbi:MAG: arginine repressor [Actinomycetota bacterium]
MKRQRQRALVELVRREPLGSQDQIRQRLEDLGFAATQSTISRDLEDLGLVRVRDAGGRLRYAELAEPNGSNGHVPPLDALMREFAVGVAVSGNIVLVRTPPGAANAVAQGLDDSQLDGLLGTVAGDDTILVVTTGEAASGDLAGTLRGMADLP